MAQQSDRLPKILNGVACYCLAVFGQAVVSVGRPFILAKGSIHVAAKSGQAAPDLPSFPLTLWGDALNSNSRLTNHNRTGFAI